MPKETKIDDSAAARKYICASKRSKHTKRERNSINKSKKIYIEMKKHGNKPRIGMKYMIREHLEMCCEARIIHMAYVLYMYNFLF